ncbi:MAG: hypothetical protein ACYDCH_09355 [Gaiellaceae bacterium]
MLRLVKATTSLILAVIVGGLALAAPVVAVQPRGTLVGAGLSIRLPAGWHGRIYEVDRRWAEFQIANFDLLRGDPDGTKAAASMDSRSILIMLDEASPLTGAYFPKASLPIRLSRIDYLAAAEGIPVSHALFTRDFSNHGRPFALRVQFGRHPVAPRALQQVNRILATLRITPRR